MSVVPRLVVLTRRSEYGVLVEEHGTANQARFALAERCRSLDALEALHAATETAVTELLHAAPKAWRRTRIDRDDLVQFLFGPEDVVACVGQDGLVANVARFLGTQPVLGVDPSPGAYEGVLSRLHVGAARDLLEPAAQGEAPLERRTMAEARLDDGRALVALNDLFVGHRSHQSARYRLRAAGADERQSSSGILVATGTGATGWALSIGRERHESSPLPLPTDPRLAFFVREAWPGRGYGASLTAGSVEPDARLVVTSEMPENGVVFADGIEAGYLAFPWGARASIGVAPRRLNLVAPAVVRPAATAPRTASPASRG